VPELRDRLGLAVSRPPADSEAAARFQLYDSVTSLLLAVARRQPLVLLFDNLHLADQSSLLLLEYYVRQLTGSASLVIAAYRDGTSPDDPFQQQLTKLAGTAGHEQLKLAGLDRNEVGALLSHTLGVPPSPGLIDIVYNRGDGNPLFTRQVAANLASRHDRANELTTDGPFDIPNSLSEVIDSRLATIDEQVLDLLSKAAVLGRDFDAGLLAHLCSCDTDISSRLIEKAIDADVVVYLGPGRYRFEHALFREALYGQHSTGERCRLHRLAAGFLSSRYGEATDPPVAQLAYHWFEASRDGHDSQAVGWCRCAAEAASEKRAYGEAAVQLERALALSNAAKTRDLALQFHLLSELAEAQYLAGQTALSDRTWLKAALLANQHRWPSRLADAVIKWQYIRAHTGSPHLSGVPLHQAALELLPSDPDALRIRVLASLTIAFLHRGETEQAQSTLTESVRLARHLGDPNVLFECLIKAFYVFPHAPDAPIKLSMIEEATTLALQSGREEDVLLATTARLFALSSLGRFDEVRQALVEFSDRVNKTGHYFFQQIVAGFRVKLAIHEGRWSEAITVAQESLKRGSIEGMPGVEGRFGVQMFTIHRALGALGSVAPLLSKVMASGDDTRTWLPGRILLHCELGQRPEARKALEQIGDFGKLDADDLYEATLVYLADACILLRDKTRCREIYKLLQKFRGYNLSILGIVSHGAASGYLAALAVALRRNVEARKLYEEALELNASMGIQIPLARVRTEYGELLLGSEDPADQARALQLLQQARASAESLGMNTLLQRIDALGDANSVHCSLTKREVDVLELIESGASNKRIANDLNISMPTVATHVRNILRKTATRNRTEAVTFARRCGLLQTD
jgi:DNA-binding NarL/FixJ family response regulator